MLARDAASTRPQFFHVTPIDSAGRASSTDVQSSRTFVPVLSGVAAIARPHTAATDTILSPYFRQPLFALPHRTVNRDRQPVGNSTASRGGPPGCSESRHQCSFLDLGLCRSCPCA